MKMSVAASSGWRLREAPFPFQQTFKTPLLDIPRFVSALLSPFEVRHATIRIETIVYKPEELIAYLQSFGIDANEGILNRATLFAEDAQQATALLDCVFGQWIDFVFIPSSKEFVIYADHDEYTTVFTANQQLLKSLCSEMKSQGFKAVEDWQWSGPHSLGTIEEGK